MNTIINVRNIDRDKQDQELDRYLIPHEIYDLTLEKNTKKIKEYFYTHINLMTQFVGFNSKLKIANNLASDRKCGCFYNVPWKTQWASENNVNKSILLFNLQVREYRYMIKYWYPSPQMSYMRYLSSIALEIVLNINQYIYYQNNNLSCSALTCNKNYIDKFKNKKLLLEDFYKAFYIKR